MDSPVTNLRHSWKTGAYSCSNIGLGGERWREGKGKRYLGPAKTRRGEDGVLRGGDDNRVPRDATGLPQRPDEQAVPRAKAEI